MSRKDWKVCKLGDVVEIGSSKRIFYNEYTKKGIPFYRSKEIIEKNKGNKISTELFISHERFSEIKQKYGYPIKGDILLTSVGTLGVPYLVEGEEFYFKDGNLTWFKNFKDSLVNKFLYYWIASSVGYDKLRSSSIGSTQSALTIQGLKILEISLPPLPEQKAIAEILSSLDDKIDLLHRQNKTLETMAESLFRHYFIDNAASTSSPSASSGSAVDSDSSSLSLSKGAAKDDWEERPLSFFGDIVCGKTPSKKKMEYFNGNVPFIKIPDMHGKIYIINTSDTLTKTGKESQENKTIPPFSICVSCIATVGLVSMNTVESQTNQQINTIIPYKEIYRYYLLLYMQNSFEILQAMGSGGTATLNINTSSFSKMYIEKPDDIILEKFLSEVKSFFEKILSNTKQIQTLEKLRDTLLPKLISGEVKVNYS